MTDRALLEWASETSVRIKCAAILGRTFPVYWGQCVLGALGGLQHDQPGAARILRACFESWSLFPPTERDLFLKIPIPPGALSLPKVPSTLPTDLAELP